MFSTMLFVFTSLVKIILYALQICMFGRAILSWFSPDEDNKVARFLFFVTEPIVAPIRNLISKIDFFNNIPIDMSFIFAFIILTLLTTVLGADAAL